MNIPRRAWFALFVLGVTLVVLALGLPSSVHVEREIVIVSTSETVFGLANDLSNTLEWVPWFDQDPGVTFDFTGPSTGPGARLVWTSDNPAVGSGSLEIVESKPDRMVKTSIESDNHGTAISTLKISPYGNGVRVTWVFDAEYGSNLLNRYSGLYVDERVEKEYATGLTRLKLVAER